jgi:hypothetical protein
LGPDVRHEKMCDTENAGWWAALTDHRSRRAPAEDIDRLDGFQLARFGDDIFGDPHAFHHIEAHGVSRRPDEDCFWGVVLVDPFLHLRRVLALLNGQGRLVRLREGCPDAVLGNLRVDGGHGRFSSHVWLGGALLLDAGRALAVWPAVAAQAQQVGGAGAEHKKEEAATAGSGCMAVAATTAVLLHG